MDTPNAVPNSDVGPISGIAAEHDGSRHRIVAVNEEFALKDLHGRTVNSKNDFYPLPADSDEHTRLDIQHRMLAIKLGGLYWTPEIVRPVLAPRPEGQPRPAILDIGTGSGVWAVEMALEFPHAEVVGIDLAPPLLASETPPPNCSFECVDVNEGLQQYANKFDAIHVRCVSSGVQDLRAFLDTIHDLLRPGGVMLYLDGSPLVGEDFKEVVDDDENSPTFSWMAKVVTIVHRANMERAAALNLKGIRGSGTLGPQLCKQWMEGMPQWKAQDHRKIFIEMGPWRDGMTESDREASELLRQNFFKICSSLRPALLAQGHPQETVDRWISNAQDEIRNMKARIYVPYSAAWALKKGGGDV